MGGGDARKMQGNFWFLHTRVRERVRGAHHSSSGFNSKYIRTLSNKHRRKKLPNPKKKMSQGDIARALDVHRAYISGIENGKRNPTLATLQKLADALDVSADELLK